MNATEPNVSPNGHYDTKSVCSVLGISRSTLERYGRRGLIKPRYSKVNMRPWYLGSEITRIWRMTL